MSAPTLASLATETGTMLTSNTCRWMSHALSNTGRDRGVPTPTLHQGGGLYELSEADNEDQFRLVKSIARPVMVFASTIDRRGELDETSEACTVVPGRLAKSSEGTIRY